MFQTAVRVTRAAGHGGEVFQADIGARAVGDAQHAGVDDRIGDQQRQHDDRRQDEEDALMRQAIALPSRLASLIPRGAGPPRRGRMERASPALHMLAGPLRRRFATEEQRIHDLLIEQRLDFLGGLVHRLLRLLVADRMRWMPSK